MAKGSLNTYFEFDNNTMSAAASFFMINAQVFGSKI